MVYEHYDREIENLNRRVNELQEEIRSLRKEIFDKTVEKNLYNTSSTVSPDSTFHEWENDYGQQGFT